MPELMNPKEDTYTLGWNVCSGPYPEAHDRLAEYIKYLDADCTFQLDYIAKDIINIFCCQHADIMQSIPVFVRFLHSMEEYIRRAPIELREFLIGIHGSILGSLTEYGTWRFPQCVVPPDIREDGDSSPYLTWRYPAPFEVRHMELEYAFRAIRNRHRSYIALEYWNRMMEGEDVCVSVTTLLSDLYCDVFLSNAHTRKNLPEEFSPWLPFITTTFEMSSFLTLLWTARTFKCNESFVYFLVDFFSKIPPENTDQYYAIAETFLILFDHMDALGQLSYRADLFRPIWDLSNKITLDDDSIVVFRALGHLFVGCLKKEPEDMITHVPIFLEHLHRCLDRVRKEDIGEYFREDFADVFYQILSLSTIYVNQHHTEILSIWLESVLDHEDRAQGYYMEDCDNTQYALILGNILHRLAPTRSKSYFHAALSALSNIATGDTPMCTHTAVTVLVAICSIGYDRNCSSVEELVQGSGEVLSDEDCNTAKENVATLKGVLHLRDDHTEFDYLGLIKHSRNTIISLWSIVLANVHWWTTSPTWYFSLLEGLFAHSLVYRELVQNDRLTTFLDQYEGSYPESVRSIRSLMEGLIHFQNLHPSVYVTPDGRVDVDTTLLTDTDETSEEIVLEYPSAFTETSSPLQEKVFEIIRDPITLECMRNPVVASDLQTYDLQSIKTSIRVCGLVSPISRSAIKDTFTPNDLIATITKEFMSWSTDEEMLTRLKRLLCCPNTGNLMRYPSILSSGQTVEANANNINARPNIVVSNLLALIREY
jgi:hypothetical protein